METTAQRNRRIKKVLVEHFGRENVKVTGGRGTAYGWVHVYINLEPATGAERSALRTKTEELIAGANVSIGTYGYDDPGSDYGFGREISIDFSPWHFKGAA